MGNPKTIELKPCECGWARKFLLELRSDRYSEDQGSVFGLLMPLLDAENKQACNCGFIEGFSDAMGVIEENCENMALMNNYGRSMLEVAIATPKGKKAMITIPVGQNRGRLYWGRQNPIGSNRE